MAVKSTIRKIAYVTGTRADFGLMKPVLDEIKKSKRLELKLYATGMHLMPEFGNTISLVKKYFSKVKRLEVKFGDDGRKAMAEFNAQLLKVIVKTFFQDKPDFVLTLGDRPEMLAAATACLYLGIPTGQVHAGDKTGTVDEIARHAITKLSHLHFPATQEAAQRVKRLGEDAWRIKVVGAPALDVILKEKLPSRQELFSDLGLAIKDKIILVTQHPVSETIDSSDRQMATILSAVQSFNLPVVMIYPNADAGSRGILKVIKEYSRYKNFYVFKNLEHKKFLALAKEAAVWVGNSSAAMIESSSFKTPVVNIGPRQSGRQRGKNVINVDYNRSQIIKAINKSLFEKNYLGQFKSIKNPWGDGQAAKRIVKILERLPFDAKLLTKQITY